MHGTNLFSSLGRRSRTIGLALAVMLGTVLILEILSVYLPVLGNPLLLMVSAIVAFGLVLARRSRLYRRVSQPMRAVELERALRRYSGDLWKTRERYILGARAFCRRWAMATREQAVQSLQAAMEGSGDNVTVPKEQLRLVLTPTQETANALWRWLVPGLLGLTAISLIGLIWLIADGNEATSPDLVLTAFTALLTGLLGLFIKTPSA